MRYRQFQVATRALARAAVSALLALAAVQTHAATLAGGTAGQISVTPTGAAQYAIPIMVPPGIAGIQPALALTYNSQGQNGLVGMGWSISGLSAITRCPKTLVQDGVNAAVSYGAGDMYCLDGQRLVAINGTYGADGTEYRTERDVFSRIVSHGSTGFGPAWFQVWTKTGQIVEYGNTADSAVIAQGKTAIRVWAVDKIGDVRGNYLTVTYASDATNGQYNGGYHVIRMDYTGNTATGLAPSKSVQFVYGARQDITPAYQNGSLIENTVVLTNVRTYVGTGLVKDYRLAYVPNSAPLPASRLASITECDGAATPNCLSPTTLAWPTVANDPSVPNANPPAIPATVGGLVPYSDPTGSPWMQTFGDFNGDGKMDFMWVPQGAGYWNIAYSTGTGFNIVQQVIPAGVDGYSAWANGAQFQSFGDFNGDGLMDYMWIPNGQTFWNVAYSTGTGFNVVVAAIPATVGGLVPYANPSGSPWLQAFGDFNGDGKMDYMWVPNGANYWNIAYSTGTGFNIVQQVIPASVGGYSAWANGEHFQSFGDFNGDGKMDYMWIPNGQTFWLTALSTQDSMLMSGVTSGLGAETLITYKPLSDPSVYTRDSGAVYPVLDMPVQNAQTALFVASSVSASDGTGGMHMTDYAYAGAKMHATGGGFLGFRQIKAADAQTGIVAQTTYAQDYPHQGLVASTQTLTSSGALLNQASNAWTYLTNSAWSTQYHVPLLTQVNQTSYELVSNGASQGPMVTQATACTAYDAYANPTYTALWSTSISSCSSPPAKTGLFVNETNNTYLNDTTNWFLGRLTGSTVTKTTP